MHIRPNRSEILRESKHLGDVTKLKKKMVGTGAYGRVWLGLLETGQFCAMKEMKIPEGEKYEKRVKLAEKEIKMMRGLDGVSLRCYICHI